MKFEDFTDGDLQATFDKNKFKYLQGHLLTKQQFFILAKEAASDYKRLKSNSHKISEALLDIANPMQYLVLLLDAIFTLAPIVSLAAFSSIGVAFVALTAVVGVITFLGVYEDIKRTDTKEDNHYLLLAMKNAAADLFLSRRNIKPEPAFDKNKYNDKHFWPNMKDAFLNMLLMTSTLFYTYYGVALGVAALASAAAIATVMTGAIGIGVAVGISLVIGTFFGYRKYQHEKNKQVLEKTRSKYEKKVEAKLAQCRDIIEMDEKKKLAQTPASTAERTNVVQAEPKPKPDSSEEPARRFSVGGI